MNLFSDFALRIEKALDHIDIQSKDGSNLDLSRLTVEPPRDPSHGDLAVNAAMILAKQVGENPRALADRLAEVLRQDADIASAEVAGPGFINIRLTDRFWTNFLGAVIRSGTGFGRSATNDGKRINVEYVSANPTGPMHVGHTRGAVLGDALANVLAATGYEVTKEYYINDAGAQIDVLARSVLLRYREALGEDIGEIPSGLYPGDYLVPLGEALKAEFGEALRDMDGDEALAIVKDRAIDAMMALIRDDLAALNVHQEIFFSERSLHADGAERIRSAINDLTFKGFVYKGKLPPPKGQVPEDWEDREQTLFRSSDVGDDMDRPLMKSDGSFTYFAADVAYFHDKYERGYHEMIYVLGADHSGYVKRLEAVAKAVSGGDARLTVILCNLVRLFRDGEPVRMSKRAGEFVTLREVVDEVGPDAVRFMMLFRKNTEPLDFDFAKVTEQSKDNPVFYVQYASARCHSVFRQAREHFGADAFAEETLGEGLELLTDAGEVGLMRKLAEYPRMIESAAQTREPHRLAFYLHDLASSFHAHWNRGSENEALRFVKVDDPLLTKARLGLVHAVKSVLVSGLGIVGVNAPEEMR